MSSHPSPDNIIEAAQFSILSDPSSNAGAHVAVRISTIRANSYYYAQLAVFTPNLLLIHAKVMTNIGRFVASAVYQLPAHLTFFILQTRIDTNTHPSESVFESNTKPWV